MKRVVYLLILFAVAQAEELISTTVKARNGKEQTLRVWIPPDTEVVRGAILQGRWNGLVTKGQYRRLATAWDFALVGGMMEHGDAYEVSIPAALKDLAVKSGHPELEHIPFITMGFSNGGWWAVNVAKVMPERTIAVAVCAMPGLSDTEKNPKHQAAIRTVPILQVNGASDGATHDWVRKENPTFPKLRTLEYPWTLAMQWKTKHKYGETNSLAFPFLQEAIRLRLPQDADARAGPVRLTSWNPEEVWMGDSRTWMKGYADIQPATEEGLQDVKQVWLLNQAVAHHWRAFQSTNRVETRVVVEKAESGQLLLKVEGPGKGLEEVEYFHGDQVLGTGAPGDTVLVEHLPKGVYSFHAVLNPKSETPKVTPLTLHIQSSHE